MISWLFGLYVYLDGNLIMDKVKLQNSLGVFKSYWFTIFFIIPLFLWAIACVVAAFYISIFIGWLINRISLKIYDFKNKQEK